MKSFWAVTAVVFLSQSAWAERSELADTQSTNHSAASTSTGSGLNWLQALFGGLGGLGESYNSSSGLMGASEISCILRAGGAKGDVNATGRAVYDAVRAMKFPSGRFNRTSLIHYLAQITAESGGCAQRTQLGSNIPAHKMGYGCIQVTGPSNLARASKCMNEVDSPAGNNVARDPQNTIGMGGSLYKANLASLCWWRENMVKNASRAEITKASSDKAAYDVHQIVNTGEVGGAVTGGRDGLAQRAATFRKMYRAEQSCRNSSAVAALEVEYLQFGATDFYEGYSL